MSTATAATPRFASALIVPVENQVRELDAKLLLSCVAAERGFPVIFGSRAFVHYSIHRLPRGIYLAKSMRSLSEPMFAILGELGHEIVAWDEEGLVRFPSADYYRRRLSAKAFGRVTMLFAWGADDAEAFAGFPAYHGAPIHVTGNPRIDLMRDGVRAYFDEEVAELRRRHGPFLLVNTNFGFVNNFVSTMNLMQRCADGSRAPGPNTRGMTREFAEGMAAHKESLFDAFRAVVPRLRAAFPDRRIVVRPHPSELPDPWNELACRSDGVRVSGEGNVVPWLIAADLVIHNGCTTAVEAAVLGTPAVAYRPVRSERFDFSLPNSLSHEAGDAGELETEVGRILAGAVGRGEDAGRRRILERHLASLDGPLSSDRIVDALEQAGYGSQPPPAPALPRRLRGWMRTQVRTAKKRWINEPQRTHRNSAAFHEHRFPAIDARGLRERIERFSRCLGRFHGLRVEEISRHVFRIDQGPA